jgi:hypothetical protein
VSACVWSESARKRIEQGTVPCCSLVTASCSNYQRQATMIPLVIITLRDKVAKDSDTSRQKAARRAASPSLTCMAGCGEHQPSRTLAAARRLLSKAFCAPPIYSCTLWVWRLISQGSRPLGAPSPSGPSLRPVHDHDSSAFVLQGGLCAPLPMKTLCAAWLARFNSFLVL